MQKKKDKDHCEILLRLSQSRAVYESRFCSFQFSILLLVLILFFIYYYLSILLFFHLFFLGQLRGRKNREENFIVLVLSFTKTGLQERRKTRRENTMNGREVMISFSVYKIRPKIFPMDGLKTFSYWFLPIVHITLLYCNKTKEEENLWG